MTVAFHELAMVWLPAKPKFTVQFEIALVPESLTVNATWYPVPQEPVTDEVTPHLAPPEPELCDGEALGEDEGEELGDEDGDALGLELALVLGDALGPVPLEVVYVTCVYGALHCEPQEDGSAKL